MECVLPHIPYDASKRQEYLAKYRRRVRTSKRTTQHDMLHISVKFNEKLRKLRLKHRATILLDNLRAELGSSFLQDVRVFMTHPVQRNLFMSSYGMNYLPPYS